jgi:hypothetical protein
MIPARGAAANKYKKCCLAKEEAVARERLAKAEARRAERAAETAAAYRLHLREVKAATRRASPAPRTLTNSPSRTTPLPNSSVPASSTRPSRPPRDLLLLFSDVHDGYDRLGMVYEARGENRQAADCYRKVIAFIREHPDDYEPGFEQVSWSGIF